MKKRVTSTKKNKRPKEAKAVNVDDIIIEADTATEALEMDKALSLYTAASAILQGHVNLEVPEANPALLAKVLGKLGEVKVSLGDEEGARHDFLKAISLLEETSTDSLELHETRASLSLYLGQLSSATAALHAYKRGVVELEACVRLREETCQQKSPQVDMMATEEGPSEEEMLQETKQQLSAAFCTIAELYLTDLCFEESAEQECEAAIQKAMAITDPADGTPLVDSLQAMASLRLSQSRTNEATACILRAYGKMESGCKALSGLVGLKKDDEGATNAQAVELVDVDAASNLPEYDFRCQTAKILLECSALLKECGDEAAVEQALHCSEASVQVLGSLLAENDEVVEVWYLLGCAFASASPPDLDTAAQYWERGLEMLIIVKEGLKLENGGAEEDGDVCDQLQQVDTQIEDIRNKLKELCGHDLEAMRSEDVEMSS